jgi:hypothetical protein
MSDMFGVGSAIQGATSLAAAGIQSSAVNRATDAQQQAAQNALNFSKQQYQTEQQQQVPYLTHGTEALETLNQGMYNGSLANWSPQQSAQAQYQSPGNAMDIQYQNQGPIQTAAFDPSKVNVNQDPGYGFRMSQGLQALQRTQAATGISGGAAAKAINDYAQGTASQEYGNAYNRALQTYNTNTGVQQQNYSLNNANNQTQFQDQMAAYNAQVGNNLNVANSALQNQSNAYNRLYQMAGIGQNAAAGLGQAGQNATQQQNAITTQLGNALSAGSAAQGNVWSNAVNQSGNALNSYLLNRNGY